MLLVSVGVAVGAPAPQNHIDFTALEKQLCSIIADKDSSPEQVKGAIDHLGEVKESAAFWQGIANNPAYAPIHRQLCIMAFFKRHAQTKRSLADLGRLLEKPNWLRPENVLIVDYLSGGVPINGFASGSIFEISIMPEAGRQAMVYIQVLGWMKEPEFKKILLEGPPPHLVRIVAEYAFLESPLPENTKRR